MDQLKIQSIAKRLKINTNLKRDEPSYVLSMAKKTSANLLLTLVVISKWALYQLDIKNDFL